MCAQIGVVSIPDNEDISQTLVKDDFWPKVAISLLNVHEKLELCLEFSVEVTNHIVATPS